MEKHRNHQIKFFERIFKLQYLGFESGLHFWEHAKSKGSFSTMSLEIDHVVEMYTDFAYRLGQLSGQAA